MYLLDTNVVSELMRPRPNPGVADWARGFGDIVLSVITLEEIEYGLARSHSDRIRKWFDEFLDQHISALPLTPEIARRAGRLRAQLQAQGKTRTQADILIAATTQSHGLTLATRNTRDFAGCGVPLFNPFS